MSMNKTISFASLLSELPNRVSGQMAENLSVPITFVCLLHLANEKVSKMFVVISAICLLCTNNSFTVTVHYRQERGHYWKQGEQYLFLLFLVNLAVVLNFLVLLDKQNIWILLLNIRILFNTFCIFWYYRINKLYVHCR